MRVFIKNDYSYLQECILCYPCNLQAVNNNAPESQVDKGLASIQYNNLLSKLMEHGVGIRFLGLNGGPSQVFTRDIGFAIDDVLFISNMTDSVRQAEIDGLKELAVQYGMKTHVMKHKVEGGDIIVDNDIVFVGQGNRTGEAAADEIRDVLEENNRHHEIVKVAFEVSRIHLDCVFNILDRETCIISGDVFDPEKVVKYFLRVIWVPDEDMDNLAPNIVQMGNNNYLCSSENFSGIMQNHGFNTFYVNFSEIIKCNGSLGCCVLPLLRN